MKIEDARIGKDVKCPALEGKIVEINENEITVRAESGLRYRGLAAIFEPVCKFKVGDRVKQVGPSECGYTDNMGQVGKITYVHKEGTFEVLWDNGARNTMTLAGFVHANDCESCEMAATITSQCEQIANLQKSLEHEKAKSYWQGRSVENTINCGAITILRKDRDNWEELCEKAQVDVAKHMRNADYWREELTKLQNEALADSKPLGEVAKIYVRIQPEKLLLSQEARRVVELLASDGPRDYRSIAATFEGDWGKTMDGIIEARDAGKIKLVDGKYQITREE